MLVELGLYTWEIIVQLPFDWSIISRKVQWALSFILFVKLNPFDDPHILW